MGGGYVRLLSVVSAWWSGRVRCAVRCGAGQLHSELQNEYRYCELTLYHFVSTE